MKISKPLDSILNTEVKTKILRFLCRTGAEWNGSQIAKEISVTPAASHSALNELSKQGVIAMRNMGNTHVYTLNEEKYIVSDILKPLYANEDGVLNKIIGIIKRNLASSSLKSKILSVSLFGSVNKGEDHPTSDIDLAVIVSDVGVKAKVGKLFEKIDENISKKFGNVISPYINTKSEFKTKSKKKLEVVKNIIKSNRLIYGERLERILFRKR
jgi:Nucleotidyltransferase domain.